MQQTTGMVIPSKLSDTDWSQTAFGPLENWTACLRVSAATVMSAHWPMLLVWGKSYHQLFNDAFRRAIASDSQRAFALGACAADTWKEVWPSLSLRLEELFATGQAFSRNDGFFPFYEKAGAINGYWTYSCSPVTDESGAVQGMLVVCYETTEAREQEQKLLSLVDNSVDLMSILELDGTNSYINGAGREILGIDADADVSTIPIADFHTPEQLAFVEAEIIPNVMGRGSWSGQFEVRNAKTGEIIPLYNNCHRIDDSVTGQPIGIGAVMRDMRPELDALRVLEEKVVERTREWQRANEELEKKNRDLESFAYVSSHDLQEPLRKINTFISRLLQDGVDNLTPQQKDLFERTRRSAQRMHILINDLLSFAGAGSVERVFVPTDLQEMVDKIIQSVKETHPEREIKVESDRLPVLPVIPFQMVQLFENLFSNAAKFVKPGAVLNLQVRYQQADNWHRITIEDNGIGFDPAYSEKIFDVFQRLHGRHEYEGTGIGLAICKKIVDNHLGTITAEGEPGKGARFHVAIPHR